MVTAATATNTLFIFDVINLHSAKRRNAISDLDALSRATIGESAAYAFLFLSGCAGDFEKPVH